MLSCRLSHPPYLTGWLAGWLQNRSRKRGRINGENSSGEPTIKKDPQMKKKLERWWKDHTTQPLGASKGPGDYSDTFVSKEEKLRVRGHIIGHARIIYVGKYQSCML